MTAGQWGQFFVVWIIISAIASPFIGRYLRKRRREARSAECARLEKLCDLADEFEAAPTTAERQAIYRKAQSLGVEPHYAIPVHVVLTEQQKALIQEQSEFNRTHISPAQRQKAIECGFTEEDEQNREWEGTAFSLDEDVQPHSDPPRAA